MGLATLSHSHTLARVMAHNSATACRYVAAVTGSAETAYSITVFSCTASKAEVIGQTRLVADEMPCQSWQIGNCIQLASIRSVFHLSAPHCKPHVSTHGTVTSVRLVCGIRHQETQLMMPVAAVFGKDFILGIVHSLVAAGMSLCCSRPPWFSLLKLSSICSLE